MSTPTTPNGPANKITGSGKVSKNPKACEECRRRKQKCDGENPCALCTKRNSQCSYRSYIRIRRRAGRASTAHQDASITPSIDEPCQDVIPGTVSSTGGSVSTPHGLPRSMPHRLAIFSNIRATQDTSRGRTELFYGASSPFSALQHLDAHLPMQGSPAVYPDPDAEEVQDGDRSIRSYNYQAIVFDHLPDPVPYLNGFDDTSYASAKIALRNFLLTSCPRLPFLNQNILCNNFEKLFGKGRGTVISTTERAIVVAALGLGAFPLTGLPHRHLFLTQARAEATTIMYDINTETVHATLMLAQLEFEAGSPNICYLHLGSAIRKAFAAGVHRSDRHSSNQTLWALYCYETLVCFLLGKQPSLSDTDIRAPLEGDASHIAHFVRLCTIVRAAYRVYSRGDTVRTDLAATTSVHERLCDFSRSLEQHTRLEIGGQLYTLSGDDLAWQVTFSYVFFVTELLLFRPFVLLCLELRRRGIEDILSERNGGVEMAVLFEAAKRSVMSAKNMIRFCESMFSLQIGIDGLYSHGFYLESACFVLALAAVHDSSQLSSECFEMLCTGLRLLQRVGSHEPIRSTTAAVEQMIARIQAMQSAPAPGATQILAKYDNAPSSTSEEPRRGALSGSSGAPASTFDSPNTNFTPALGETELLLDDIWSVMDWNVGFPWIDLAAENTSDTWGVPLQ